MLAKPNSESEVKDNELEDIEKNALRTRLLLIKRVLDSIYMEVETVSMLKTSLIRSRSAEGRLGFRSLKKRLASLAREVV